MRWLIVLSLVLAAPLAQASAGDAPVPELGDDLASAAGGTASALTTASLGAASAAGQGLADGLAALGRGLAKVGEALLHGAAAVASAIAAAAVALFAFLLDSVLALAGLARQLVQAEPAATAIGGGAVAAAAGAGAAKRRWGWPALLAPLSTRLLRSHLLDHPIRARIVDHIRTNPGVHLSELSRQLGVAWGTLTHHLRHLQRAGIVVEREFSGRQCLFVNGGTPREARDAVALLRHPVAARIHGYYRDHPWSTQRAAGSELGLSESLVSWHLARLERAGLVQRQRQGRTMLVSTVHAAPAVPAGAIA